MDQEVASKKILLTCLIASSIYLLVLALTYQFRSNSLHVCNRDNKLTVMLEIPPNKQILFYPDDTQAVIECLSLYMPFYDRSIEMVINETTNSSIIKDLNERYQIVSIVTKGEVNGKSVCIKASSTSSLISTTTDRYKITKSYQDTKFTDGYSIVLEPKLIQKLPNPTVKIITSAIDIEEQIVEGVEYIQNGRSNRYEIN